MIRFSAAIVAKDLGETVPQRAFDRAAVNGQWYEKFTPVFAKRRTRKGTYVDRRGFKSEADAIRAMEAMLRVHKINPDEIRGLVWERGRENEEATTVAL